MQNQFKIKHCLVLVTIFAVLNVTQVFAQQQAMATQYMFNGLAINPAFAGSYETLSFTAHLRSQWTGYDGAPNTQSFSAHGPLRKDKIALGLFLTHDKIGVTSVISFAPSYAFRIHFKNESVLSLGIQFVLNNYKSNFTQLNPATPVDVAFNEDVNRWLPNFGTGAYYYTPKFYIGGSVPLLLSNAASSNFAETKQHFYFTGGYVFRFANNVVLKPNILFRGVVGSPFTIDLNTNVYFLETVGLGVSYRLNESLSVLFELLITDELRFGYSYDYILNELKTATTGSHEIMLNYRFGFSKDRVVSPRYF